MKYVPKAVTRLGGRTRLKLSANAPTILVVSGVIGFGATAIMAAKASRRAEPVMDNHHKGRIQISEVAGTQAEEQKMVVSLYKTTGSQLAVVYGPSIVVGTLSAASILYGHKILNRRHVATMMAYSGLMDQFAAYRGRVAKTLGAEAERDIYDGAHGEWVEDPDHKGEHRLAPVFSKDEAEHYLRPWFNEGNSNWRRDPAASRLFLQAAQSYANVLLQSRGYIFLNEVRQSIGLEDVPEGQIAGWLLDGDGDNFVDFGFMTSNDPDVVAFREGHTDVVRLNFNIDGLMYDRISHAKRRTF